jgi:Arc/MetJ-type ribon-helix-helix transcriptional regulator
MTRQTTVQFDEERKSIQLTLTTDQQIRDLVESDYGASMTEVIRHAVREAWERQAQEREWWHWAVRLSTVHQALESIGAKIDAEQPWRGVNDDDKEVTSGYWRAQPWCDPGADCHVWVNEVAGLRAELNESAGVFYVEHVDTRPIFQTRNGGPRYDSGYLIAVSNNGKQVAFRKVI